MKSSLPTNGILLFYLLVVGFKFHFVPHTPACAYDVLSLGKGGNANGIRWC